MNRCVNRLPKVGQKVNLNSYEVYFEVTKVQKPISMVDNLGTSKENADSSQRELYGAEEHKSLKGHKLELVEN